MRINGIQNTDVLKSKFKIVHPYFYLSKGFGLPNHSNIPWYSKYCCLRVETVNSHCTCLFLFVVIHRAESPCPGPPFVWSPRER